MNVRVLGLLAIVGPCVCTGAWLLASSIAPGYDPWREDLSALAAAGAAHPWITVIGCSLAGPGFAAAGEGLRRRLGGRDATVAAVLLLVAGMAMLTQAFSREDCSTELAACMAREAAGAVSWHHELHSLASVVVFLTPLGAAILLARAFGADPAWRNLRMPALVWAGVGLALLVAYFGVPRQIGGFTERVFVTWLLAGVVATGVQLWCSPGSSQIPIAAKPDQKNVDNVVAGMEGVRHSRGG